MSVNKQILVANLGQDPECGTTTGGSAFAKFTVATSEKWKDKNGQQQEKTDWHNCKAYGRLAEIIRDYLKKGSKVYLEGSNHTDKYEQDGQDKYFNYMKVNQMQMLDSRASGSEIGSATPSPAPQSQAPANDFIDDGIPF